MAFFRSIAVQAHTFTKSANKQNTYADKTYSKKSNKQNSYTYFTYSELRLATASRFASVELDA